MPIVSIDGSMRRLLILKTRNFAGICLTLISLGLIPVFPLLGLIGAFGNQVDQDKEITASFLADAQADTMLVSLGYVGCTSTCPITLATLRTVYISYTQLYSRASLDVMFIGIPIPGQIALEDEVDLYAKHFHKDFKGYGLTGDVMNRTLQEFGASFSPLLTNPQELSHTSFIYLLQKVDDTWILKHTYTDYPPKSAVILNDLLALREKSTP